MTASAAARSAARWASCGLEGAFEEALGGSDEFTFDVGGSIVPEDGSVQN